MAERSRICLSFLAHPDDAEILCAGTLIRLADAGWTIHIATATAGDCGTATESAEAIRATRRREASEAAALIGATYHCLEEMDALVVYDKPTLRKTIDLFRQIAPSLVFTHAASDYMRDHEVVNQLTRAASFIYGAPNVSTLPMPTGAVVPHLYYCDPLESVDALGGEVSPTTYVDISRHMERKQEMLAKHASQREWLRAHHGMDEYIEAMRRHAAQRGRQHGCEFAEAFVQQRSHAFRRDDLLAAFFGPGR